MLKATGGLCEVRTIRPAFAKTLEFAAYDGELVFGFVLDGTAKLNADRVRAADAFVIPPGDPWTLSAMSDDFRLLHVTTARLD